MNTTEVTHIGRFENATSNRAADTGLVTVSNHTSTVDDPFVFSALLPLSFFASEAQHKQNRWSLCAREICFRNFLLEQFFRNGKVIPIDRGLGLNQKAMHVAAAQAASGKWVHIFPEGKVIYGGKLGPCKWGVGKLVCDCYNKSNQSPVVLPFFHSNMGSVMPKGAIIPRAGHKVHVTVGLPLDVSDLTPSCAAQSEREQHQAWRGITARIAAALLELEEQSPSNPVQVQGHGWQGHHTHQSPPLEPHPAI